MSVEVIPFHPAHIDAIADAGQEALFLGGINIRRRAEAYVYAGPAMTAIDGDTVLACFGVLMAWRGVGEAWAVISELARTKYKVSCHKIASRFLDGIQDGLQLHRIQTTVREDFDAGVSWVVRLGFDREGLLMAFGPNREDYFMYARIR